MWYCRRHCTGNVAILLCAVSVDSLISTGLDRDVYIVYAVKSVLRIHSHMCDPASHAQLAVHTVHCFVEFVDFTAWMYYVTYTDNKWTMCRMQMIRIILNAYCKTQMLLYIDVAHDLSIGTVCKMRYTVSNLRMRNLQISDLNLTAHSQLVTWSAHHSHLMTRSSRHTVIRSTRHKLVGRHTTQSTRHKVHNKVFKNL